ncbi:MAG TPA: hypothetical protein ENI23_04700 [bacterium]|nr:hypothetical protein [bacterium]
MRSDTNKLSFGPFFHYHFFKWIGLWFQSVGAMFFYLILALIPVVALLNQGGLLDNIRNSLVDYSVVIPYGTDLAVSLISGLIIAPFAYVFIGFMLELFGRVYEDIYLVGENMLETVKSKFLSLFCN